MSLSMPPSFSDSLFVTLPERFALDSGQPNHLQNLQSAKDVRRKHVPGCQLSDLRRLLISGLLNCTLLGIMQNTYAPLGLRRIFHRRRLVFALCSRFILTFGWSGR